MPDGLGHSESAWPEITETSTSIHVAFPSQEAVHRQTIYKSFTLIYHLPLSIYMLLDIFAKHLQTNPVIQPWTLQLPAINMYLTWTSRNHHYVNKGRSTDGERVSTRTELILLCSLVEDLIS